MGGIERRGASGWYTCIHTYLYIGKIVETDEGVVLVTQVPSENDRMLGIMSEKQG